MSAWLLAAAGAMSRVPRQESEVADRPCKPVWTKILRIVER
jgi:hypothetical protein